MFKSALSLMILLGALAVQSSVAFVPITAKIGARSKILNTSSFDNIRKLHNERLPSLSQLRATKEGREEVVIIGAGWGGLSCAHNLHKSDPSLSITVVDASPRVGGLVRDGFLSINGKRNAEAGQHGFWDNYHNIFALLEDELPNDYVDIDQVLSGYDVQGQYSPNGLEAEWPVYRSNPQLPTGLAQALYTKFTNLSILDRITAAPLVLAFSEFDNSPDAWEKYDQISFRELCIKLGVSKRCYEEAFEPMILTGLFAPGAECSAAAALGMAYFFVLKSQNSFDVRWCRGNTGEKIFQPWVEYMAQSRDSEQKGEDVDTETNGVKFMTSNRVVGFENESDKRNISKVICKNTENDEVTELNADTVVFAVGGAALNAMVRNSPLLAKHEEFRKFANLRGTGVLATRLYFDRKLNVPYSANACWGFDKGVGQTLFDINKLHDLDDEENSILEVDYYHAASLLVMDDESIVSKVKKDLEIILGEQCVNAKVSDAAVVRLPSAVNWYAPGSYAHMPDLHSKAIPNAFFVGDLVKTDHGSWSQEKAYVTGAEAANLILKKDQSDGIIPLSADEIHVAAGRQFVALSKKVVGFGDASRAPSLVDFLW
uniref:Amine oxidase domain-containing protein n=1 Tax=Chaetoceros debilis TaxID=122233 RepID=A0A7S3V8K5_9STRA